MVAPCAGTEEAFAAAVTQPRAPELPFARPLMPAAGCFGFGDVYDELLDAALFGAVVTRPIAYRRRAALHRDAAAVLPLPAGCLIAEPRANPGLSSALSQHRARWQALPVPLICHLIATDPAETRKAASRLDEEPSVAAIELGLPADSDRAAAHSLVSAARRRFEKPLLVRLPLLGARDLAESCAQAGADALVVSAPPRGAARDPATGHLVRGSVYGPWLKSLVLPLVLELGEAIGIPIVAAGGVHSAADARDYLAAGAFAVQVDSLIWRDPAAVAAIARELNAEIAGTAAPGATLAARAGADTATRRGSSAGR